MNFASTNSSPENRGSRVRDGQKPREFSGFLAIWHPGARRPETPFLAIPHPGGAAQKPPQGEGEGFRATPHPQHIYIYIYIYFVSLIF